MAALEIKKQTEGYFRFILDGDSDNAIIDNAPNATSFGPVFNFKTKNGANLIKKQYISYDQITYIDILDVSFTFSTVDEVWIKLIDENFFEGLNQGGGSGSTRFDELLDTFSYIGNDGKVPVVDQPNLRLIPSDFYNYKDFIQLQDVSVEELLEGKIISVGMVSGVPKLVLTDPGQLFVHYNKPERIKKGFENNNPQDEIGDIFKLWKNDGTQYYDSAIWNGGAQGDSDNFTPLVFTEVP